MTNFSQHPGTCCVPNTAPRDAVLRIRGFQPKPGGIPMCSGTFHNSHEPVALLVSFHLTYCRLLRSFNQIRQNPDELSNFQHHSGIRCTQQIAPRNAVLPMKLFWTKSGRVRMSEELLKPPSNTLYSRYSCTEHCAAIPGVSAKSGQIRMSLLTFHNTREPFAYET